MKRVWRYLTAVALLSVVLLAGIAAAEGGGMTIARNGDAITITGTTNLAAGDQLQWNVVSASFTPTQKGMAGGFSGAAGTTLVQAGSPLNTFSIEVDVSGFPPDEYLVTVQSVEPTQSTSTTFNILEATPTTVPTTAPTTVVTTAPPAPVPTTMVPTTVATTVRRQSGFGALVALVGLGAVALLVLRRC